MTVREEPPHYKKIGRDQRALYLNSFKTSSPSLQNHASSLQNHAMVGRGRQKIELKLIEKKEARLACFSKRRMGLFKKAKELSILCGATVAALAFSPAGKPMPFDAPKLESLIDLKCCPVSPELPPLVEAATSGDWESEFHEVMDGKSTPFWWEKADVQSMGLEELLRFERSILCYREKQMKNFDDMQQLGSSSSDLIFDDLMLEENQQKNNDDCLKNVVEEFEEWFMDGRLKSADPCTTFFQPPSCSLALDVQILQQQQPSSSADPSTIFFQQHQQPLSSALDAQILQLQRPVALEEIDDSSELLPMPTHLIHSFVEDGYISIWDF